MTTIEGPNVQPLDPYRIQRYGIGAGDSIARFAGLVHHTRTTLSWRRSAGGVATWATGGADTTTEWGQGNLGYVTPGRHPRPPMAGPPSP